MAKIYGKDIVYFNKAGVGVIPGIVLSSRLEQQADNSLAEVLTLLYAHPSEEKHASHHASEIGSTQFSVKPLTKTNAFGWSDTKDGSIYPNPEPPAPQHSPWIGLSDGHGGWTREDGSVHTVPAPPDPAPEPTDQAPVADPLPPVTDPDTPAPEHVEPAA